MNVWMDGKLTGLLSCWMDGCVIEWVGVGWFVMGWMWVWFGRWYDEWMVVSWWFDGRVCVWMCEWMDGYVIQLMDDTMDGWLYVWVIEWVIVRMEGWLGEAVICFMHDLIVWLVRLVIGFWVTDCFVNWLDGWLDDWVIAWLVECVDIWMNG
jgi:hypothetical protein